MKFKIEIECENDAFGEFYESRANEVYRILDSLAVNLKARPLMLVDIGDNKSLYDFNGNKVGFVKLTS